MRTIPVKTGNGTNYTKKLSVVYTLCDFRPAIQVSAFSFFRLIDLLSDQDDLVTVDWLYHQMQKLLGEHLVRLGLVKEGLSEIELKL